MIIRDLPNGHVAAVPPHLPRPSTGPGAYPATRGPEYYVARMQRARHLSCRRRRAHRQDDRRPSRRRRAPPSRACRAAADDRTFVILTWRPLHRRRCGRLVVPGEARPGHALPRAADPAADQPRPARSSPTALSASGTELAVATAGQRPTAGRQELDVYSVATGGLLHDWSTTDSDRPVPAEASARPASTQWPALTWIDGDRAIAFAPRQRSPTGMRIRDRAQLTSPGRAR